MNHVAKALNKSQDEIREINFYKKGQVVIAFYLQQCCAVMYTFYLQLIILDWYAR